MWKTVNNNKNGFVRLVHLVKNYVMAESLSN